MFDIFDGVNYEIINNGNPFEKLLKILFLSHHKIQTFKNINYIYAL